MSLIILLNIILRGMGRGLLSRLGLVLMVLAMGIFDFSMVRRPAELGSEMAELRKIWFSRTAFCRRIIELSNDCVKFLPIFDIGTDGVLTGDGLWSCREENYCLYLSIFSWSCVGTSVLE